VHVQNRIGLASFTLKSVAFAIEQPADVDVNEIIVRPAA
jgi:hypothetical protein